MLRALAAGDVRRLAALTEENFRDPLTAIIPWASNAFTERLIDTVRARFGDDFWGFWMLGGMSGGGMGFFFEPSVRERAEAELGALAADVQREFDGA